MSIKEYRRKRNFSITSEPTGAGSARKGKERRFVIQKHAASRLHYDFRLELGRTLVSWAVPKGLPMAHGEKRLAVRVEDHPLSYFDFEGTIPKGQYGGGTVQVWETGTFEPLSRQPMKDLEGGKLHFVLHGSKLSGEWYLVRLKDEEDQWLIIRGGDDHPKLTKKQADTSALSGKTLAEIAKARQPPEKKKGATKKKAPGKAAPEAPIKSLSLDQMAFVEPMMARLVEEAPPGEWVYELKFDGFRALAYKQTQGVGLLSRTNHDLTNKFPEVVQAVAQIEASQAVIDGEIVALDPQGRSSFQLLQAYELGQERPPICYYAFDLLKLNGKSLVRKPLEERKEMLAALLPEGDQVIRFSAGLGGDAEALLTKVGKLGLEGLIGKRTKSAYEIGKRSGAWIKLKLVREQEFVIGGYTDPSGSRHYIGALLVGVYEKGKLRYAGKVGTGFDAATLSDLHQRFRKIARRECPFSDLPEERTGRYGQGITASVMKRCHWLKPELVAQLKFAEWTRDHRLRQPVFLGLREDKPAKNVVREVPA